MNILTFMVMWGTLLILSGVYIAIITSGNMHENWITCIFWRYENDFKSFYKIEVLYCAMYTFIRILIHLTEDSGSILVNNPKEFYITVAVFIGIHLIVALIYFIIFLFKNSNARGWLFITSCLILCGLLPITTFTHLLTSITIIMSIVTLITGIYYILPYANKIKISILDKKIKSREKELTEFKAKQNYLDQLDKELKEMKRGENIIEGATEIKVLGNVYENPDLKE